MATIAQRVDVLRRYGMAGPEIAAVLGITEAQVAAARLDPNVVIPDPGGGGGVPTTRQVIAGTGLSGGGALSSDVTLTLGAHKASHATGGSDVLSPADIGAQPQDSDLDAISALATTSYGRSLLTLANLAALYTALAVDTDGTLAGNSDTKLATQKATKTYADQLLATSDAMIFKGVIDCSSNPNWPAADRGHTYKVSVAGKIGGASGQVVKLNDTLVCTVDGSSAGTDGAVGANWIILTANTDGQVIGPASATDQRVAVFSGTSGKLIADGGTLLSALATLASPALTGSPTTPTQTAGDNSTKVASTAYADALAAATLKLTNKRLKSRVTTITSSATPTVNTDSTDMVSITALAAAITSMTSGLTGTPDDGDALLFRIKDNGTARAITWGALFEAVGVALPTTTVISKRLTVGFIWDAVTSKWGCVSVAQEA